MLIVRNHNHTSRILLLALRPFAQFDRECYREFGKLEHVCETELRGDVNTAATLL